MNLNMGKPKAKPQQQQQSDFGEAKLYLWVKALESKVNNLLRETEMLKNDYVRKNRDLRTEMKTMSEGLIDFKHQHEKTVEKMDMIIKELKQTAGIEEVMTIKKYLDLWSPLNFVTQRDLDRAIENKLLKNKKGD
jgi:uncharacterized protein YgiM (DUF1202 family)